MNELIKHIPCFFLKESFIYANYLSFSTKNINYNKHAFKVLWKINPKTSIFVLPLSKWAWNTVLIFLISKQSNQVNNTLEVMSHVNDS